MLAGEHESVALPTSHSSVLSGLSDCPTSVNLPNKPEPDAACQRCNVRHRDLMNLCSQEAILRAVSGAPLPLPLAGERVHAGFPSPAADHEDGALDLSRHFVRHPSSTFIVRVSGDSLNGIGIRPGDYLVVDRSREVRDGNIVLAIVDGDFAAKRYRSCGGQIVLAAENPQYPPIPWRDGCEVWGVVTSIHRDLTSTQSQT